MQKKRIAVLLGGVSNEKEISLESGRNVSYKLSPHRYEVTPVFLSSKLGLYKLDEHLLVCNSTQEIERQLKPTSQIKWDDLSELFDFVFIALHGGHGENGCVQGALELFDIPYNGSSVLTSALCMDKFKTNAWLQGAGFDVPRNMLIARDQWHADWQEIIKNIMQKFSLPCIVKPHDDGCSVLVEKVVDNTTLKKAIDAIFAHNKTHAMIEEYIHGMELTGGVIGNRKPFALPPSQALATKGVLSIEEKFLPGAGENQTPAPLPCDALSFVQKTLEEVYKSVGCKGYARIDCFYQHAQQSATGKERLVILEINTLPGLTPATCIFHQAAEIGLKPADFIDLIMQLGFEEHGIIDPMHQTTMFPDDHKREIIV